MGGGGQKFAFLALRNLRTLSKLASTFSSDNETDTDHALGNASLSRVGEPFGTLRVLAMSYTLGICRCQNLNFADCFSQSDYGHGIRPKRKKTDSRLDIRDPCQTASEENLAILATKSVFL